MLLLPGTRDYVGSYFEDFFQHEGVAALSVLRAQTNDTKPCTLRGLLQEVRPDFRILTKLFRSKRLLARKDISSSGRMQRDDSYFDSDAPTDFLPRRAWEKT